MHCAVENFACVRGRRRLFLHGIEILTRAFDVALCHAAAVDETTREIQSRRFRRRDCGGVDFRNRCGRRRCCCHPCFAPFGRLTGQLDARLRRMLFHFRNLQIAKFEFHFLNLDFRH